MTCPTCNTDTSHIKILSNGREVCHNCGGFAESGGVATDHILTRNADRVREQQHQGEGDMITPYVFDKATKQLVVNHDFIEMYPNQAANTFSAEELENAGHSRLLAEVKQQPDTIEAGNPEFTGNEEQGIKEVIDGPVSR